MTAWARGGQRAGRVEIHAAVVRRENSSKAPPDGAEESGGRPLEPGARNDANPPDQNGNGDLEVTPARLPKHRTSTRAALLPAFVSLGIFAGACGSDPKVVVDEDAVDVSNISVSPSATHTGGILALTFDVDAASAQTQPFAVSVVLRSGDIGAEVAAIEIEGIGSADVLAAPVERHGLRFDRQVLTFAPDSDNLQVAVLREFQIPPDAPALTYEVVLRYESEEIVVPTPITVTEPTEPDLIITNVSLANNSFELLGDESTPINTDAPPPLAVNLEVANTGTDTPEGVPVVLSVELACGDATLVLPLSPGGSEPSDTLELAPSLARNAVQGVSASVFLPTEGYVALAELEDEITCQLTALINPGAQVSMMPIQFLPLDGAADASRRQADASGWASVYDLSQTLGASASGKYGADNSIVVFNTSYTVLPNFLKYKLRDLGGFSNVPLGVDFQSHFNTTLNVGFLGFNGAFVLADAEALLTVDAEELLGVNGAACDPTRAAVKLSATAFNEDVFPPFEVSNPCPPEVNIPEQITVSKSFDLFNKEFDRTLFAVTVPVGPVPVFSNMGAKGRIGLAGNVQLDLFPLDARLQLTATGGPSGELGAFVEGGVGIPVLGIGIRSELSLIEAEMSVRPSLSVDLLPLENLSSKLDVAVPLTLSSLDGAVKFVVNLVLFSYDYTFLNWEGFSDKWMLFESSGKLSAGDLVNLPPKGPWTELCDYRSFENNKLTAACRATAGGPLQAESSATNCAVYVSANGKLACGNPPAGTWQNEGMTLISWDGEVLCAKGKSNSGQDVTSCLPGCGTYRKALDGSGKLACLPAPGPWQESCRALSYNGVRLKASCRTIGGDYITTTVAGCSEYHNVNGHLSCPAPPGNWASKCRPHWFSYDARSDTLTALCDNSGFILSGDYMAQWSGCGASGFDVNDVHNNRGVMTCPLPGGSWRGAGQNIVPQSATFDGSQMCAETLSWIDRGVFSDAVRYRRTCASNCVGGWAVAISDLLTDPPGPSGHMSCNYDSVAPGGYAAAGTNCKDAYASDGQICGTCQRPGSGIPPLDTCSPKGRQCRLAWAESNNAGEQWQGVLVCQGESLPAGEWRKTCRATVWDGDKRELCAYCQNNAGSNPTGWPVDAKGRLISHCATCNKPGHTGFRNSNSVISCD